MFTPNPLIVSNLCYLQHGKMIVKAKWVLVAI